MTRSTNPNRQYAHDAGDDASAGAPSSSPRGEKKPVCYRCRQGIARGQSTHAVSVWAASNRPQVVTVCGPCLLR